MHYRHNITYPHFHILLFASYLFFMGTMNISISQKRFDFVSVENTHFMKSGKPYYIIGTNVWYGMNLGIEGKSGDRARLIRELDRLQSLGINNLRIMGTSEGTHQAPWRMLPAVQPDPGTYNEEVWRGLDFLLNEMALRNMTAVICLNNFWPWSGGMSQYLKWATGKEIPYPPPAEGGNWAKYQQYTVKFYQNEEAQQLFRKTVQKLIFRINTYNGKRYHDDPTIMSWQLANEPRGFWVRKEFTKWIEKTAKWIHELDTNHLVSLGSEGNTNTRFAGTNFQEDHTSPYIDYTTIHIWAQNWGWYDPLNHEKTYPKTLRTVKKYIQKHIKWAQALNKPLVLEEFGLCRDLNSYEPNSSTTIRNQYFSFVFDYIFNKQLLQEGAVAGGNFWAWAGEGRPRQPKAIWKVGDTFIGDPPHEYQGWYSVYDTDTSTLAILKSYVDQLTEWRDK